MPKSNLVNKRFGRLTVKAPTNIRKYGKIVWLCKCDCGNTVYACTSDLTSEDTQSCGCLKKEIEKINLSDKYEEKRVNGIMLPLFKGKEPRKDSSTGYRGVAKYYTRLTKQLRYKAYIVVNGKRYSKSGFKTPEEAYYHGRLELEKKYLPKKKN